MALPPFRPASFFCAVVPPCLELPPDPLFFPPLLDAFGELAMRAARSFDIPLSFNASYCFSFLTFALLLGTAMHLRFRFIDVSGVPLRLTQMSLLSDVLRRSVDVTTRGVEVALSLPRIAVALERLADSSEEVRRFLNTLEKDDIDVARETLEKLADAVGSLNNVVASLNSTISPLQGATERLGRFVDRIPARGRGRVLDVPGGSQP